MSDTKKLDDDALREKIRTLRHRHGLSVPEIQERLHISRRTVSRALQHADAR